MNAWDENAERRRDQILSGIDLSYAHVILPAVLSALGGPPGPGSSVLDVGCGTGFLSRRLSEEGWVVTAIDTSSSMIAIAKRDTEPNSGISYVQMDAAEITSLGRQFDAIVANMSLTGVVDLPPILSAFRANLKTRGHVVITDVHPWFWRNYKLRSDVSYWDSTLIDERFTISLDPVPLPSPVPVVYRPLEALASALCDEGFLIDLIREPRPGPEIGEMYPSPWEYPRFIVFRARNP